MSTFQELLEPADLPYEEDVVHHGHMVKTWLRYLAHASTRSPQFRIVLYERAVQRLPRSYKLWKMYLDDRVRWALNEATNACFERALQHLGKMPVLWHMYCVALEKQGFITRTRQTYDRALRTLPVTQHDRVWELFTEFARACASPSTCIHIYRRFLRFASDQREDFVEYLREKPEYIDEASLQLVQILNDPNFRSTKGRSKQDLWMLLCELITSYPDDIVSLRSSVESIIRSGMEVFKEETGRLWAALAVHYIGLGLFERARAIYEEGLQSALRVKDFALIWDAYSEFEEGLLQSLIERDADEAEFILQHARYQHIVSRRALLLNSVKLRQNPNNIDEWHRRVHLFEEPAKVLATYKLAIASIDNSAPMQGRPSSLWIGYARYYEQHGQPSDGRDILLAALEYPFRAVEDLSSIYCELVELDVRRGEPEAALKLLRTVCVAPPRHVRVPSDAPSHERIFRSTKLWAILADLEESCGTLDGVRFAYDSALLLRVATPQMILNYAYILEQNRFFEDAFQVYERGLDIFEYPFSMDLWIQYISKFIERYKGEKVERARDIFEQALEAIPAEHSKTIYILYGDFEERFGLARRAMSVYERATRAVEKGDQYVMFLLYIARATEFFGVTRAREVYEDAIKHLEDKYLADICLRYAALERALGEVDRARVVYRYCSNFCDPRSAQVFWQTWHNFEVSLGNEETFRDMLRIKRSVTARFNASAGIVSKELLEQMQEKIAAEKRKAEEEELARQRNLAALQNRAQHQLAENLENPDVMDIGSSDEDDEDEEDNVRVVQQEVPRAVFGSVGLQAEEEQPRKKTRR